MPQIRRPRGWLAILFIVLMASGCGLVQKPLPHPNQINPFDGAAYDALQTAQGAINQGKQELHDGTLPAAAKKPLNAAIHDYDLAQSAWKAWRDCVLATSCTPTVTQDKVQNALDALAIALSAFKSVSGVK